jgi:hypothetical protein
MLQDSCKKTEQHHLSELLLCVGFFLRTSGWCCLAFLIWRKIDEWSLKRRNTRSLKRPGSHLTPKGPSWVFARLQKHSARLRQISEWVWRPAPGRDRNGLNSLAWRRRIRFSSRSEIGKDLFSAPWPRKLHQRDQRNCWRHAPHCLFLSSPLGSLGAGGCP